MFNHGTPKLNVSFFLAVLILLKRLPKNVTLFNVTFKVNQHAREIRITLLSGPVHFHLSLWGLKLVIR